MPATGAKAADPPRRPPPSSARTTAPSSITPASAGVHRAPSRHRQCWRWDRQPNALLLLLRAWGSERGEAGTHGGHQGGHPRVSRAAGEGEGGENVRPGFGVLCETDQEKDSDDSGTKRSQEGGGDVSHSASYRWQSQLPVDTWIRIATPHRLWPRGSPCRLAPRPSTPPVI